MMMRQRSMKLWRLKNLGRINTRGVSHSSLSAASAADPWGNVKQLDICFLHSSKRLLREWPCCVSWNYIYIYIYKYQSTT
jgi:hypothetical protein